MVHMITQSLFICVHVYVCVCVFVSVCLCVSVAFAEDTQTEAWPPCMSVQGSNRGKNPENVNEGIDVSPDPEGRFPDRDRRRQERRRGEKKGE